MATATSYQDQVKVSFEDTTNIPIIEAFETAIGAYVPEYSKSAARELGIKSIAGRAGQLHQSMPITKLDATRRAKYQADALSIPIPRGGAHVERRQDTLKFDLNDVQAEVVTGEDTVMNGDAMMQAVEAIVNGCNRYRTGQFLEALEERADLAIPATRDPVKDLTNVGGYVSAGVRWQLNNNGSTGSATNSNAILIPTSSNKATASSMNSAKLAAARHVLAGGKAIRSTYPLILVMPYQSLFDYKTDATMVNRDITDRNSSMSIADRVMGSDGEYWCYDGGVKIHGIPTLDSASIPYFEKFPVAVTGTDRRTSVDAAGARTGEIDPTLSAAVTAGTNDVGAFRAHLLPTNAVVGYMPEGMEGGYALEMKMAPSAVHWNIMQLAGINRESYRYVLPELGVQITHVPTTFIV